MTLNINTFSDTYNIFSNAKLSYCLNLKVILANKIKQITVTFTHLNMLKSWVAVMMQNVKLVKSLKNLKPLFKL